MSEAKLVKFNIGSVHESSCPVRPLLWKAGNKVVCQSDDCQTYRQGLIAYMVLGQRLKPFGMKPRHASKSLDELQRFLVKKLLKLGYDFGEQPADAQALIDDVKRELGLLPLQVEPPREPTYSQTRTVTVVLERKGFTLSGAVGAKEDFSGDNIIEDMKADGFKVVSSSYSKFEGRAEGHVGGGVEYFGWRKDND